MRLPELLLLAAACVVVAAAVVALAVRVAFARRRGRHRWPGVRTTGSQARLMRPRLDTATERRRLDDPDATQQRPPVVDPSWPDIDPDRQLRTDPDQPGKAPR